LSDLFPLLDEGALDDLAEDIREHGLREPIVMHEGKILDGRNRYLACQRAKVKPEYREFLGSDPLSYVISVNLHRRHLDERQRAMVAAKIAKLQQGQRQRGQLASLPTQAQAARLLNVSRRSVKRAAKVQAHGTPELVDAVKQGKISLARAERITRGRVEHRRRDPRRTTNSKPANDHNQAEARISKLNSLSWSEATREERVRFIDAVGGLEPFWEAAHPDMRTRFVERHRMEWEQDAKPPNSQPQIVPSDQIDPFTIPDFLRRTQPAAPRQSSLR
jgi:ParB-like chromosome segregation protein Spo0J